MIGARFCVAGTLVWMPLRRKAGVGCDGKSGPAPRARAHRAAMNSAQAAAAIDAVIRRFERNREGIIDNRNYPKFSGP
jgi:hypothetical protein